MAWKNLIAHKVTRGYLNLRYKKMTEEIKGDPKIRDFPFYNEDASEGSRNVKLRKFAGEMTKYLAEARFTREAGRTLDAAYQDILEVASNPEKRASHLGDVVNANFKFMDEN